MAADLNHTLFWNLIGTPDQTVPEGPFCDALKSDFGSVKAFRITFREIAIGHFGSGWVFLVADANKNALEVLALPDHNCVLVRTRQCCSSAMSGNTRTT